MKREKAKRKDREEIGGNRKRREGGKVEEAKTKMYGSEKKGKERGATREARREIENAKK
jgi:hypothetical protein